MTLLEEYTIVKSALDFCVSFFKTEEVVKGVTPKQD